MYNEVDVIGKKGVTDLMKQSKLCKFIIFRGGSTKGSTPVFRCTETSQIPKAIGAFEDWADSILRMNRNNNFAYDMFLYSSKTGEAEIDESVEEVEEGKKGKTKTDKIRFTFSLNPYNNSSFNGSGSGEDIGTLIAKALDERDKKRELEELREFKRKVDAGEIDTDDDDEDESEDAIFKITNFLKEIRLNKSKPKAQAAGDDEDDDEDDIDDPDSDDDDDTDTAVAEDDDDDDEPEEKPVKKKVIDEDVVNKKRMRIKKALRMLATGNPDFDKDLMKLAKFKEAQPKLFSNYMSNLRNMNF